MALEYQRMAAFLSSNQAKMTFLPLEVCAVSTPRQPGVALSPATRSGNPPWAKTGVTAASAKNNTASERARSSIAVSCFSLRNEPGPAVVPSYLDAKLPADAHPHVEIAPFVGVVG